MLSFHVNAVQCGPDEEQDAGRLCLNICRVGMFRKTGQRQKRRE